MNNRPGTRANIPLSSRTHIVTRALEQPCIPRRELAKKLQNELKEKGFDVPEQEVLERMISKARNHPASPLDKPWSLATLDKNPIPPEVIPIVLDVKQNWPKPDSWDPARVARINKELEDMHTPRAMWLLKQAREKPSPFTVREAKWTARIALVLKDKLTAEGIGLWARFYADFERACEVAGIECDTSNLDIGLLIGDFYAHLLWTMTRDLSASGIHKGKQEAQDIERKMLGHSLEDIELTPLAWALYYVWLGEVEQRAKKWPNLSIKEREDFVKRLRAWVIEREPVEELMYPDDELFTEVDYIMPFGKTPVR